MGIKSLRSVLFASIAVFAIGCGDSNNDNSNPAPQPGERPAEISAWTSIDYSQLLPTPPQQCGQPERFSVQANGQWQWRWCTDQRSGTLSASDLADLDQRAVEVREAGFEPEICMELSYAGDNRLHTTYNPEGLQILHTLNRSGSCYRGKADLINRLEEKTVELMKKYTGVSTQ